MAHPTTFQAATILLMETFKKYAGAEGKKDTLTKAEFKTLMDNEMPILGEVQAAGKTQVDQLMKELDQNKDQEIDFMEYMALVAGITTWCFKLCNK